jgi:hypothetical protein
MRPTVVIDLETVEEACRPKDLPPGAMLKRLTPAGFGSVGIRPFEVERVCQALILA